MSSQDLWQLGTLSQDFSVSSGEALCLARPGSNPAMDLGNFQFRIAANLFSLGVGLFPILCNGTMHTTLPSSFLFPIII